MEAGGYHLIEKIGSGQFGEVWRARDPEREEEVALKILSATGLDGRVVSRFKDEFEILTTLHHPHLAPVYHFGLLPDAGRYFFTSEFCRGRHFFPSVEGRPVSYFEELFVQLLSALDYIHSQGIVHSDIKSQNILVEERDRRPCLKLVDFGLAARFQALPRGRVGTLAYMAPEVLSQSPRIDTRADLYAVGILALRALSGDWPFDIKDPKGIMEWHLKGDVPEALWSRRDIPKYLQEIMCKLLKKNPSERFSHARVILSFLNLAAGGRFRSAERELHGEIPLEGPLVERTEVVESLKDAFSRVFYSATEEKIPSGYFVSGELGVGKTRILEEIRHFIELGEIPVFEMTCDRKVPTWTHLAGLLGLPKIPEIPLDPLRSFGEAALREEEILIQRAAQLRESSRKRPFALLIDDLHKAEAETQTLIRRLAKKSRGRFFIVAATEEGEGIPLRRLTLDGIVSYASQQLGVTEKISEIAERLFKYSGGLPLLVCEGLRYLAPSIYRNESLEDRLPPPGLGLLYQEKIAGLSAEEKEVLRMVALLYRPVAEEELAEILGSEEIGSFLRPLRQRGLVEREILDRDRPGVRLTSQALGLDVTHVLSKNDPDEKKGLHGRIAEGLIRIASAEGRISPEEIAFHLAEAGRKEAGGYYIEAAALQKRRGQISNAVGSLTKAIRFLEAGSAFWEDLNLETAHLLILQGAYAEASARLQGMTPSVRLHELQGWISFKRRRFDEAQEAYQRGADLAGQDLLKKTLLSNAMGNVALQKGETAKAHALFDRALALEDSLPPLDRIKVGNNHLGLALALEGRYDEALCFYQGRLDRLPPEMISERIALDNSIGYILLQGSRYGEAISRLGAVLDLSEKSGAFHCLFSILGNLTTALLKETRYTEALALLRKMESYQEFAGTTRDVVFNRLRQGSVYLILGMEEAARDCIESGQALASQASDPALANWLLLMEGYWEREFGSLQKSRRLFEQARESARGLGDLTLVSWSLYALSDLALEEGELELASVLSKEIPELTEDAEFSVRLDLFRAKLAVGDNETSNPEWLLKLLEERCLKDNFREALWEIYQVLGRSAQKKGDSEEALEYFRKGIDVIESIAAALPEEYRDRYRHQRSRQKLFEEQKEVMSMPSESYATRLLEISKRMVTERDPERLLEFIMDTAIELSGASQGLLLLADNEGKFEPRVARNVKKENLEAVNFSRSVAREVVRTGQPFFSLNAPADEKLKAAESVMNLDLKTVACVPLKSHNKVTGAIYLDTGEGVPPLRREFLPTLTIFADQAALALANALLFQEKETRSLNLEKDLLQTRKVLEEREEHLQELEALVSESPRKTLYPYEKIIGRSKRMEEIFKTMDKITNAQVPVFILGETGTGKELLARALHQNRRKKASFVAINCSAFPETILESELFGYCKGAFTGADRDRKGLFEEADGGTLFLDEVGDMSPAMQAKLLRAIQEQEVMRVGGRTPIKVSVRVVSASNKDLKKMVREGTFREDLYFRIAGITVSLPPLRERKEDIPLLVKHLIEKIRKENNLGSIRLGRQAMNRLVSYDWPGNIRELDQCLTNACLLAEKGEIREDHLLFHKDLYRAREGSPPLGDLIVFDLEKKMEDYEREILLKTLEGCGGNKSEAARRLGLSRLTMHKKLKAYGTAGL